MTIRHDLALSILIREIDERLAARGELQNDEHPLSRYRYTELCAEIGQLRMARDALAPAPPADTTDAGYSLEDYCTGGSGDYTSATLDAAALKTAARQVLHAYAKPGGHPAGSFISALIRIWGMADMDNQSKLMSQWPELCTALCLMRDGREDGLRNITEGKAP